MPAGNYGEVLLRVADELCVELGFSGVERPPGWRSVIGGRESMEGILSPQDEVLARRAREALARIAATLGFTGEELRAPVVTVALDGAELALRGELASGNGEELPQLMPSLVFLVALPLVDEDRALALSRRTAQLIAEAQGEAADEDASSEA